jgi:PIN domain nuclease of toxin-antitoxin system
MRALLDTHTFLFWLGEPGRLGPAATRVLRSPDSELLWSVASSWEIAIKVAIGKLAFHAPVAEVLPGEIARHGLRLVAIEHDQVFAAAALPKLHADPFDRLLVAQARALGVPLVTADAHIAAYGVATIW